MTAIDPRERAAIRAMIDKELARRKLEAYQPYARQLEFHAAGAAHRERLFCAGNQLGKTMAGAAEMAMHLTGRYPADWRGRKFSRPIAAWASGVTGESVRDTTQRLLVGRPGEYGTGMIPAVCIASEPKRAMGVADLLDSVTVKHVAGGTSRLYFKRYEQGREKWQGETLDVVWYDEEPPADIYTEGLTRTNATGGIAYMTFTPLQGMSEVVMRFLHEQSPDRHVTYMTIDDAEHYTPEQRSAIVAAYPAHDREARAKGIPTLGSGRIFQIEEESIKVDPFKIPAHWPRINGIDFGWDHPAAAAQGAWDRDSDCWYVVNAHRAREQTPVLFAPTVKAWGAWVPCAWPHDGLQHDKGSGKGLAQQYADAGLKMLKDHATHAPGHGQPEGSGGNGVEAGLMDMLDRMQTGRLKVFSNLDDWFQEFRMYHRKDGRVVTERDDLMCLHPDTKVITDVGLRPISSLVGKRGLVMSTDGLFCEYQDCRMTRQNADLVRVTFSDGLDLLCTPDHKLLSDGGEWVEARNSAGIVCHNAVSRRGRQTWTKSLTNCGVTRSSETTTEAQESSCIGRFGRMLTGQYLQASTFITKTETATTTALKTLKLLMDRITCQRITRDTQGVLTKQLPHKQYGERRLKENHSYPKWAGEIITTCGMMVSSFASVAARSLSPKLQAETGFVLQNAKPNNEGSTEQTWFRLLARFAKKSSWRTNSSHRKHAPEAAEESCGYQQQREFPILSVLRVQDAGKSDVFCMEVPGPNAFSISNGAVVHNCASRYGLMMRRKAIVQPVVKTFDVPQWSALDAEVGY